MRRALLTAALVLLFAAPAQAATFQVNVNDDSTVCNGITCSLRGAIAAAQTNLANEDDVINVPAGTYTTSEALMSGVNATRITIVGAGANSTFWQPAGTNRMLSLSGNLGVGANVTLRGMTVRGGRPASGNGGNLSVSGSTLSLVGVRVTNGQAVSGGGIAVTGSAAATLNVTNSLIDTNAATGTAAGPPAQGGGGIYLEGQTFSATLNLTDSTVAFNTASRGGGIFGQFGSPMTMRGGTVAFNRATILGTPGGLQTGTMTIQGSIIAANIAPIPATIPATGTVNCAGTPTDQGGNVEDVSTCGLGASSRPGQNPQLATALDETQQPPTLAIPETSPAVDFAACGARTTDQRGMTRPLGTNCDAGAYEFDPRPDTTIAGSGPPFTLTSSDANSTFECSLDGAAFTACASPLIPNAAPGAHSLSVRAVDPQGNVDPTPATVAFTIQPPPTPTPTPSATPTPVPTPVVNKIVVVKELKGTVKVKRPGSKSFVNLDLTQGIPVGSTVDTKKGTVELTSIPKAGAPPEKAKFFDGIFKVTQSRGITNLTLSEALAACPKAGKAAAAAKKPKTRKLWGDGKGKFRTSGKYSAATVRGTKWLVQDSCAGTLTRVTQGTVDVRDNVKRKTFVIRAGKRYTARPKR